MKMTSAELDTLSAQMAFIEAARGTTVPLRMTEAKNLIADVRRCHALEAALCVRRRGAERAVRCMFTDDEEYVIAESVEDVRAVLDALASPYPYDHDEIEWTPLPADQPFAFNYEDARGVVTKTVAEWVAERGRGYFAGPL